MGKKFAHMKNIATLFEELNYNRSILNSYDGDDKEVREELRINIKAVSDELKRRGYLRSDEEDGISDV